MRLKIRSLRETRWYYLPGTESELWQGKYKFGRQAIRELSNCTHPIISDTFHFKGKTTSS